MIFIDSSHLLAVLNERDPWHKAAIMRQAEVIARQELVLTTEFVLLEVFNALSDSSWRATAIQAHNSLIDDPLATVVQIERALYHRGIEAYTKLKDKDWSLTDCISFLVMQDYRIGTALSADRHFVQAGFRALLLEKH